MPPGADSLRAVAWAGLQDSMPRAALLSIHARVEGTAPTTPEDPALVQVWGPRFQVYAVATSDAPIFTLGRLPDTGRTRRFGEDVAERLDQFLAGRRMTDREAAQALGNIGNAIRYATFTGRVRIRWEGARAPLVWTVPKPAMDPFAARLELARRHIHVFGPTTAEAFTRWAGIGAGEGRAAFDALLPELSAVGTPLGERWMLADDQATLRGARFDAPPSARLLPSGDAYFLLQGTDRELLVPDAANRAALWTPRVWPGALLVDTEICGTWRRDRGLVTITPWRQLSNAERAAVEAESASLPIPGVEGQIAVRWS